MQEFLRAIKQWEGDDGVHSRPGDSKPVADPESTQAAGLIGLSQCIEVSSVELGRRLPFGLDEIGWEDDCPASHAGHRG